jgi:hypothetical protein
MAPLWVRLIEHAHGHAGWLTAALLVHPAVLLRNRTRRLHGVVVLPVALVTAVSGAGAWLYVLYREQLRRDIFTEARAMGLLFERKEHLAFGTLVVAWAGCAAYFAAERATEPTRALLRTFSFRAFCAAAALALVVATLGTVVSSYKSF